MVTEQVGVQKQSTESTARCRQEFLIDTLLGNELFLTVLPV